MKENTAPNYISKQGIQAYAVVIIMCILSTFMEADHVYLYQSEFREFLQCQG